MVAPGPCDATTDKILALWLNSSLGLLSVIASVWILVGHRINLKKPILEEMFVIDPRALSVESKKALVMAYDKFCKKELQALPHIGIDEVRAEIDKSVCDALGLPDDLSVLRKLLSLEPVISMKLPG